MSQKINLLLEDRGRRLFVDGDLDLFRQLLTLGAQHPQKVAKDAATGRPLTVDRETRCEAGVKGGGEDGR